MGEEDKEAAAKLHELLDANRKSPEYQEIMRKEKIRAILQHTEISNSGQLNEVSEALDEVER